MQKWEEIEQKKEYLKGYIKAKNREALIKDQIQQLYVLYNNYIYNVYKDGKYRLEGET